MRGRNIFGLQRRMRWRWTWNRIPGRRLRNISGRRRAAHERHILPLFSHYPIINTSFLPRKSLSPVTNIVFWDKDTAQMSASIAARPSFHEISAACLHVSSSSFIIKLFTVMRCINFSIISLGVSSFNNLLFISNKERTEVYRIFSPSIISFICSPPVNTYDSQADESNKCLEAVMLVPEALEQALH